MKNKIFFLALLAGLLGWMQLQTIEPNGKEGQSVIKVTSSAFSTNGMIPKKYTCDGEDVSPPLAFEQIPPNTKSLAIIVDDPDAPVGLFVHWVAWGIPADSKFLQQGSRVAHQGVNNFGEIRYRGPCPPRGKPHHYHFKIYALDTELNLEDGATKEELEAAMKGHILAQGELVALYQRQ